MRKRVENHEFISLSKHATQRSNNNYNNIRCGFNRGNDYAFGTEPQIYKLMFIGFKTLLSARGGRLRKPETITQPSERETMGKSYLRGLGKGVWLEEGAGHAAERGKASPHCQASPSCSESSPSETRSARQGLNFHLKNTFLIGPLEP